ncbi:MAG TPA: hypothetical protein VFP64_04990 [Pyrinomonadaceae bacterium]|nr:hypothetical protein [Pyrinomonadaceae bacterium]
MQRFAPRLAAALLTFALGVLVAAVRNDLRFGEWLWNVFRPSTPATADAGAKKCFDAWENASNQTLGWDLTYFSVIKKKLCPGDALCDHWAKPAPPIPKHIAEWQGDPIISSIEIELPDGHAGMVALWFIRTKDQAYYWGFYPLDTDFSDGKHVISTQDYDTVLETISCWVPVEPPQKTFGADGYIGFLSMYKEGKSRQMLLTYEDFIERAKYPKEGDIRRGPFRRVLEPLFAPLTEKQRQPHAGDN